MCLTSLDDRSFSCIV